MGKAFAKHGQSMGKAWAKHQQMFGFDNTVGVLGGSLENCVRVVQISGPGFSNRNPALGSGVYFGNSYTL